MGVPQELTHVAGWIQAEQHARSAVGDRGHLCAEEPPRTGGMNLEVDNELAGRIDAVELIESGVESSVADAGSEQLGLRHTVIHREKVELYHVPNRRVQ